MSKKKSHVVRVSDTTLEKLNQLRKSDDKSLDQVVSRLGNEGEQKINLNSLHEAWQLSGQSSNDRAGSRFDDQHSRA
jgi:predicted KAP-like P-loop ATPase